MSILFNFQTDFHGIVQISITNCHFIFIVLVLKSHLECLYDYFSLLKNYGTSMWLENEERTQVAAEEFIREV